MLKMCKLAFKLPQIQFAWNNPLHKMLLPGHPGGVSLYEQCFWTAKTFVSWDNKMTSTHRLFLEPQGTDNFKIMTWIQDLPHPC